MLSLLADHRWDDVKRFMSENNTPDDVKIAVTKTFFTGREKVLNTQ
jgi:hypothetical protein